VTDTPVCPECGAGLSADAPRGLCPRCLMNAGLAGTAVSEVSGSSAKYGSTLTGVPVDPDETIPPSDDEPENPAWLAASRLSPNMPGEPSSTLSLDAFKRAVVELGIVDTKAIDRLSEGVASGLAGLVRSLIQSRLLTAYQACAIQQGKARGLVVGRYLVLDKLGKGGMGVVFKARHRLLDRVVALKILPPSFARKRELVLRFRREMHAAARLDHPNVVSVLDADEDRGVYFLAMEYIEGRDLDRLIRERGALPVEQTLDCTIQAARGLAAAHAQGIVHRDIKPGNLMLDATGMVRVLDLGLARLVSTSATAGETTPDNLTRSGVFMGTVDFMAPEQAEDSRSVDHRADIYSLACTLYFLLTGRAPFASGTVIKRVMAHQQLSPPSIRASRPDVPESLDAAYLAMMAKNPDDRPESMTTVIALLDACRSTVNVAEPRSGLGSFSRTLLEVSVPSERESPVLIASDNLAGSELDTVANVDDRDLVDRRHDVTQSGGVSPILQRDRGIGRPGRAWNRPAVLAALGSVAAIAVLIVSFFAVNRRGGDVDSPSVAGPGPSHPFPNLTSEPNPEGPVNPVDNQPDPSTISIEKAATVVPLKTTEARVPKVPVPDVPKLKPVAVPTYDVAPLFTKHAGAVRAVAVSRDGRFAVSAGLDHSARLWDVRTGKQHLKLDHPSEVMDAAIAPDRRFALTATKGRPNTNGIMRLWNLNTGKAVFSTGVSHVGYVASVAFVPNNRGLSGGQDGHAVLWDLALGRPIGKLGVQKGIVRGHAMAVFLDGHHALTGGEDGVVHLWNLANRKQSDRWIAHQGPISGIAVSSDGRRAVTCSQDHTAILWDVAKGYQLNRFTMPGEDRPRSVAFMRDGNVLAAGGEFGEVVLWDSATGAILRRAQPPFVVHWKLALLPDDRFLTADQDGLVRIWTARER
jgi:eukaryotic-like serine/threonine-protein kinase